MPDITTTAVTPLLAAASEQPGLGGTLRIVLLVSIVGGALLAWFLLRGYGNGGEDPAATEEAAATQDPAAAEEAAATQDPAAAEEAAEAAKGREATAARTENGPGDANA
ncbi:hypothetical protein ACFY8W_28770 [Streptomyces sp. NPDC012637]|uniref:hypothetical protein n=1 Tax=Streptomyces sp. NPDC012637 TaxID=3364842 RepID=UPI0036E78E9D